MESSDSDRFKRRLIRSVASMINKGVTGNDLWNNVQENTGCDCSVLWQRMRCLTISRIRRLLPSNDTIDKVQPVARMARTDWLMYDLILVHENIDVIYVSHIDEQCSPQPLLDLLSLVIKFNIENEDRKKLPRTWLRLTTEYNKNGRYCSAMLLQKRWFQMKEATRKSFYQFWFTSHRNFTSAKNIPRPLYILVASRFPKFISSPFIKWLELVDMKKVVLPSDFESIVNTDPVNDKPESECVLLEPKVDIVNIPEDTTQDEAESHNPKDIESIIEHNEIDININEESNLQEEVTLETRDNEFSLDHTKVLNVKSEPTEPTNSDINGINPELESTDYLSQIQIVATTHIEQGDTLEGEDCDVHESLNGEKDSDVVIKVKNEHEADQIDDNTPIIEKPNPNLDINEKQKDLYTISSIKKEFPKDKDDDTQSLGKSNNEKSAVNKGHDFTDIAIGVKDVVGEANEIEADDEEDEYCDLEFVDDGIDFIDNDYNDKCVTTANEDAANDKMHDEKLVIKPIVYTKKLENMNILKNKELNSEIDVKDIINDIISESKPRYEADVKENATAKDDIEQDMEDDHETISLTSPLLQKPTHCTYNPIVLCKNPDFNTRLKRLGVGFLTVPKNLQLLKACKPVSIDLHKAFENKLVNGVLYLKTDSSVKRAVNFEPPVSNRTATSTVIPSALAAQALINNSSVHFEPYVHNSIETSPATSSPIHVQTLINNSSVNVKPTVSETIATTSTVSPSASSVSSSMKTEKILAKKSSLKIMKCEDKIVVSSQDLNKYMKLKAVDYSNPKTKAKPIRQMTTPWFFKPIVELTPAQQKHSDDDVLLAEATVSKILNFFIESIKGTDNIGDFKMHPIKPTKPRAPRSKQKSKPQPKFNLSDEDLVRYIVRLNESSVKEYWRTKTHCCWMRQKMEWLLLSHNGVQLPKMFHNCLSKVNPVCTCCCTKQCSEYKPQLVIPPAVSTQPITATSPVETPTLQTSSIPQLTTSIVQVDPMSSFASDSASISPKIIEPPIIQNETMNSSNPVITSTEATIISTPTTSIPSQFTNPVLSDNVSKKKTVPLCSYISIAPTPPASSPNFEFKRKYTQRPKSQNPVVISSEKGRKISIDATWLDSPYSRSLGMKIISGSKNSGTFNIQPLKRGKKALYVGLKKILLTTANMNDFENVTLNEIQDAQVVNSTNTDGILKNTTQSNKNVVTDNVPEQAHDNNELKETNTSKKSILSDLMEMSGISAEDTDAGTTQSNTSQIKQSTETDPNLLNALKLYVICSLAEVKWATRQNAKFFTLDFSSGHIFSVSIHIKQFQTKVPINDVIEIEDSDEEAPEKRIKMTNSRKTSFRFATSILKHTYANRNNRYKHKSQNTEQLMIVNRKNNEHKKRKQTHDTMIEEYLLDSDDSILNSGAEIDTLEASSDDEPLSAVSKRMRTNDNVEENEESIKPNEVILENEESIKINQSTKENEQPIRVNEEFKGNEESILGI